MTLLMTCSHIQGINMLKQVKLSFFSYDLDLDPITLILKLDLDMVKMYLYTKNEVYVKQFKSYSLNRQTHRHTEMTENIAYPHTRVVIIILS